MKKIITLVAIMLISFSATAQKKKKKKGGNNDCYIEAAVSTFSLSEENKAKLVDFIAERNKQRATIKQKVKSSEIAKEDVKKEMKAVNQGYFKNFADLTGKPKKEIMVFEKETKGKCSKKKKK